MAQAGIKICTAIKTMGMVNQDMTNPGTNKGISNKAGVDKANKLMVNNKAGVDKANKVTVMPILLVDTVVK